VKLAHEDTQLAFYAALLADDTLRAAYVNVGERGATEMVEQPDIVEARDALVEGITEDLRRIAQGATLTALGEGRACEFCAARGLCRKDSWHE
jgi:ATP-dependent helicase/nuclease subunit B